MNWLVGWSKKPHGRRPCRACRVFQIRVCRLHSIIVAVKMPMRARITLVVFVVILQTLCFELRIHDAILTYQ